MQHSLKVSTQKRGYQDNLKIGPVGDVLRCLRSDFYRFFLDCVCFAVSEHDSL